MLCLFTLRLNSLSLRFVESQRRGDRRAGVWIFVLVLEPRDCRDCRSCRDCRLVSTGIDRWRQDRWPSINTAPEWRGHSCLRASTRADRNVCPTIPRSIAAASRDGFALPALPRLCRNFPCIRAPSTTADPHRPPSRLAVDTSTTSGACYQRYRHCLPPLPTAPPATAYRHCLPPLPVSCPLSPVPSFLASLASWRFKQSQI